MALLLDIDGTVLEAGRAIPGATEAIREFRRRGTPLLFATNISRSSRAEVAAMLRSAGIDVEESEILSAGYAAARVLQAAGVRRVHLLLTASAMEDFQDFEPDAEAPEAVVVGDLGPEMDFSRLNLAFRCLRRGARLIATQKNRFWKAADGPTLDAGAFVAGLEYAADVRAEIVGKPEAAFFRSAAALLGADPSATSMVGDDVESDVGGAKACGMRGVLVRTGKFDPAALARVPAERSPDLIVDSIRDLPDALAG
jgi:HAD superfamily hydrolase (TIGR01458 family)